MKKIYPALFLLIALSSFAQEPRALWSKYILNSYNKSHNDKDQFIFDGKRTLDNALIIAGADTGFSITKNAALNKSVMARPWLMKLDTSGQRWWYGTINNQNVNQLQSAFLSVQQVIDSVQPTDQGYVAAGYAGDVNDNDPGKFYIARFSLYGIFQWDKMYGGTGVDRAYSVQQVGNSGYVAAGFTTSNDGDVSGNHGKSDVWLVRLNSTGGILWKSCFGGSEADTAYSVVQTADKGFLVAGTSASNNGNLTGNAGGTDAWVFKTDSNGTLLWQKTYGGSGDEAFKSVVLNANGTYTFVGYSSSTSLLGTTNAGKKDLWMVNTTLDGDVIWSKLLGGTGDEQGFSVQTTPEGNNLVSGYTESNNGTVTGNNGGADAWLLKLSANGILLWQKCVGTTNDEVSFAGICLSENSFMMAGFGKALTYTDYDGYLTRLGYANTIKGILFRDDNSNGIKDANEVLYNNQAIIQVKKGGAAVATNYISDGKFTIGVDTGNFVTSVQVDFPYYQVVPSVINSSFQTYFNTDSLNFALQPLSSKKDLSVNVVPLQSVRPGFPTSYRLVYKNVGTTTIPAGQVLFKKDSRLTLVSSFPAATATNGDTLKWDYADFKPADSSYITIHFQVAPPPAVNINDTLSSFAVINPVAGDETPTNDTAALRQLVRGSLDPNDKLESHGGSVSPSFVSDGSYLQYTIRFQNTGTDVAFNIAVKDTLSDKLDWSSFQMIDASHSYNLLVSEGNKITWAFNNINLPDKNTNDSASNGYVVYRIRPKSSVLPGDIIHNTASLYFDFNLPERTNDASTAIVSNLAILPQDLLSFSGNQQNEKIVLYWNVTDATGIKQFEVERSVNGKDFVGIGVQATDVARRDYSFTDVGPQASSRTLFYRLKLVGNNERFRYSNVLFFRTGNEKEAAVEVYPNPVAKQALVAFSSTRYGKAEMQILNMNGAAISKMQISVLPGKNIYSLSAALPLSAGTYFVRLAIDGEVYSTRFVVQ